MKVYYASLVRGLIGYYVKFYAQDEMVVRRHLGLYFGRMWCSVYTEEQLARAAWSKRIVNEYDPIVLEEAEWE